MSARLGGLPPRLGVPIPVRGRADGPWAPCRSLLVAVAWPPPHGRLGRVRAQEHPAHHDPQLSRCPQAVPAVRGRGLRTAGHAVTLRGSDRAARAGFSARYRVRARLRHRHAQPAAGRSAQLPPVLGRPRAHRAGRSAARGGDPGQAQRGPRDGLLGPRSSAGTVPSTAAREQRTAGLARPRRAAVPVQQRGPRAGSGYLADRGPRFGIPGACGCTARWTNGVGARCGRKRPRCYDSSARRAKRRRGSRSSWRVAVELRRVRACTRSSSATRAAQPVGGSVGSVSPHTFRHTAAVHLLESGVDVNVIGRGWATSAWRAPIAMPKSRCGRKPLRSRPACRRSVPRRRPPGATGTGTAIGSRGSSRSRAGSVLSARRVQPPFGHTEPRLSSHRPGRVMRLAEPARPLPRLRLAAEGHITGWGA